MKNDYDYVSEDEFSAFYLDDRNSDDFIMDEERDKLDTDALGNCFTDADPGL